MSKNILLYKNITALSRDKHNTLKLKPIKNFRFAADTHWLPIAGTEFYQASHDYSIVFMRGNEAGKETLSPIVLTGLEAESNDYISKGGRWKENTYLPAFVRSYPFIAYQEEKASELTLCFDAAFSGFNKREGLALFNEDGNNSDFLDGAIQFIKEFNLAMKMTHEFVALLQEIDLLEKRNAEIRHHSGKVFHILDFFQVSEKKLAKLTGEQLAKFHAKGYLGWMFAHLISLRNLPSLAEIHLKNKMQREKMLKNKAAQKKEVKQKSKSILLDSKMPRKGMLN